LTAGVVPGTAAPIPEEEAFALAGADSNTDLRAGVAGTTAAVDGVGPGTVGPFANGCVGVSAGGEAF
jgi:hypothetical protein